jgi:hypothetical protein
MLSAFSLVITKENLTYLTMLFIFLMIGQVPLSLSLSLSTRIYSSCIYIRAFQLCQQNLDSGNLDLIRLFFLIRGSNIYSDAFCGGEKGKRRMGKKDGEGRKGR